MRTRVLFSSLFVDSRTSAEGFSPSRYLRLILSKRFDNRGNRIFMRSSFRDIASFEFIWIDVAHKRAQRFKMRAARDCLIVFFEKRHRHGNL